MRSFSAPPSGELSAKLTEGVACENAAIQKNFMLSACQSLLEKEGGPLAVGGWAGYSRADNVLNTPPIYCKKQASISCCRAGEMYLFL